MYKKDLLYECNTQGLSEKEFSETFCAVCKNRTCDRAQWAYSTWDERIGTQYDRFFKTPVVKQSEASKYQGISDFEEYHINPKLDIWTTESLVFKASEEKPVIENSVIEKVKPIMTMEEINTDYQTTNIYIGQPIQQQPAQDPWALPPKTLKVGGKFQMGGK